MKYKKYISTLFIAAMLLPLFSAKAKKDETTFKFDINSIEFVESPGDMELGFDTTDYLPEGFNPYEGEVTVKSINYIEEEDCDLGFDTAEYLPEDFDPYKR